MDDRFLKVKNLFGDDDFSLIKSKTILLLGVGGVGSAAFECLLRSGVTKFILVDNDVVNITNLNRQIVYRNSDVGVKKVKAAKEYAKSINPDVHIEMIDCFVDENISTILSTYDFDIICDCIDYVPGKIAIMQYAQEKNIPLICSLGMANKMDPRKVDVVPLNKTTVDPLARKIRYEVKNLGLDISKIMCVYSSEEPIKKGTELNSIVTVTMKAGLMIASYVLSYLAKHRYNI